MRRRRPTTTVPSRSTSMPPTGTGSGVAKTEVRVRRRRVEAVRGRGDDPQHPGRATPSGRRPARVASCGTPLKAGSSARPVAWACPWYRVKDYGDFALKFQWRDAGTGSNGNGGAFVRFPNPVARPRPAPKRNACQVGSARLVRVGRDLLRPRDPDQRRRSRANRRRPVRSTTSAAEREQAKVQPNGAWNDYEIQVGGQKYTIIRNGEVIQAFDNTPDKQSSRAGDPHHGPPVRARATSACRTTARRDMIEYRNMRVEGRWTKARSRVRSTYRATVPQGRVPLDRRSRERGDDQVGRLHYRWRPDGREDPAGHHELAQPGRAGRGRDLHRSGGRDAVGNRSG